MLFVLFINHKEGLIHRKYTIVYAIWIIDIFQIIFKDFNKIIQF